MTRMAMRRLKVATAAPLIAVAGSTRTLLTAVNFRGKDFCHAFAVPSCFSVHIVLVYILMFMLIQHIKMLSDFEEIEQHLLLLSSCRRHSGPCDCFKLLMEFARSFFL